MALKFDSRLGSTSRRLLNITAIWPTHLARWSSYDKMSYSPLKRVPNSYHSADRVIDCNPLSDNYPAAVSTLAQETSIITVKVDTKASVKWKWTQAPLQLIHRWKSFQYGSWICYTRVLWINVKGERLRNKYYGILNVLWIDTSKLLRINL